MIFWLVKGGGMDHHDIWIFLSLKDSFMEHQLGIAIAVTMFLKQEEYQSKLLLFHHDSWIP